MQVMKISSEVGLNSIAYINEPSNIVSSVLGRFELKNHMINIFEGISILK